MTDWTPTLLNECWLLEVAAWPIDPNGHYITTAEQAYWAALCWVHRTANPGEIEAHAVAAPQYHGRWLTRDVLQQLDYIIDHTACTRMVAEITSPLAARVWRKLGFTITEGYAYKDIDNGWSKEAARDADGRTPGPARDQDPEGTETA